MSTVNGPEVQMKRALDAVLIVILILSVGALFLAHEDPFARTALCAHTGVCLTLPAAWYKIFYDLGVGALISLLFYWLVVRLPDYQRRRRLKNGLARQYHVFRADCIGIMLSVADGTYLYGKQEALIEPEAFRKYFNEDVGQDQDRWDAFFNKLDEYNVRNLRTKMEIFRDQISFVLNNTDIPKDELQRLSTVIYSMKDVTASYNDKEVLTRFLWELFAGWSYITGARKDDIVKKMIKAI
jgi:hypothetical protein